MQPNRFNPFRQIHKGLRALLYDTSLRLQQADFEQEEKPLMAIKQVQLSLMLFDGHAEVEDHMILPLIHRYNPALIESFNDEHQEDERLAKEICESVTRWLEANTEVNKIRAGAELLLRFNGFVAFNLAHMNREERELNPVLWAHYSDMELHQLVQEIAAKVQPEKNQYYMQWMLRGNSPGEIAQWMNAVKRTAPQEVFEKLYILAAANLEEAEWQQVKDKLETGERVTFFPN